MASSIVGCPSRVSKASGNDSKQSLMVPVAQRILTGASLFFLPDGCNRATASYEIKHPWAPKSMSAETGTPFSSASIIRNDFMGSRLSGRFEFQKGLCLQGDSGASSNGEYNGCNASEDSGAPDNDQGNGFSGSRPE